MAEEFSIRLSKAAKEFNVGVSTIVDYLKKKGISIENNPNTKIGADAYAVLVKEYQSEKTVKEESRKVGIEHNRNESISLDDSRTSVRQTADDRDVEEEIMIKTNNPVLETEDKKADIKPVTPVMPGPKILGKVDLDKPKKTEKPATEPKAVKEPVTEPKPAPEVSPKEEEKIVEPAPKAAEAAVKKPATPEPQIHETATPNIKAPVVLGKIELPEKKSAKVSKKPKAEEKKEKPTDQTVETPSAQIAEAPEIPSETLTTPEPFTAESTSADIVTPAAEPARDENFLKTRVEKLSGVTIVGKMELPVARVPEKKPVASSSDPNVGGGKKKKRKRIRKPEKAAETTDNTQKDNKPQDKNVRKKFVKEAPKVEVSDEDIQKQIRETLARLSSGGKSKASKHRRAKRDLASQHQQEEMQKMQETSSIIQVTEFVTANELATLINVPVTEVISTCMSLGLFVSINQRLDAETLSIVAEEFGYKLEFVSADISETVVEEEADLPENLSFRHPIATVMGHVDHGKTSLLDYIRHTNVIAGEAGGITQHIGAYEVTLDNGKKITFLDTPGHEAFTAMRARGAKVTDVAIIVVAADDAVMPQTKEAINHAQAAGVPIVFAINKMDKPNANPEKIKQELASMNILVEDWGGKYQSQEISAKKGLNVDVLLEKVLLEVEILDLKANPKRRALGTVIESALDKGRGYITKVLVQNGTLKVGDMVLAGTCYGKVKAMYNERNIAVKEAGPSTPILLLGLNGAPQAGDLFNVMADERETKSIANKRLQLQREQGIRTQKHITLDEIGRRIAIGDFKELNIIVKGDVDGSVEALSDSLIKLSTNNVQVNVIHKSVGQVTESDVLLASASNAIIIGFQVRPSLSARKLAEQEQIDLRTYSIIYNAIEEVKSAMEGMLAPEMVEKIICNVEVRETFKISKVGTVAGCMVLDGKLTRNTKVRVIRDGIVIYTGHLESLKRFKDDAKEVTRGMECGLNIEKFNDIKTGDIIEGFEISEVKRTL